LAANKYNARNAHRIPTRLAAAHGAEAELLQVSLALAFTIQQKLQRASRATPLVSVSVAEGINPAFERIVTCARYLTEATGAALALGDSTAMSCVARSGASAPPLGAVFDGASGLSGEAVRTSAVTICVNAAADPRVNYQACKALNIASILYFPLHSAQGKMIGMLGVFSSRPRHFSPRDVACLRLTEGLVQEAVARSSADPDPATLGELLKQADLVKGGELPEFPSVRALTGAIPGPPQIQRALDVPALEAKRTPPAVEPTFVGRIVDEAVADEIELSEPEERSAEEPRSRIPLLLAVIVALAIAGVVLFRERLTGSQNARPLPAQTSAGTSRTEPAVPPSSQPQPGPELPVEQRLTSQVSLRSTVSNATVTILLNQPIRFEGYQLSQPDRIYFDLHGIKLADAKGNAFKVDTGLIERVRLSDYAAGVTRVVFDLRQPATFDSRLERKPDRLIIEVRTIGSPETTGNAEPTAPAP
ncbi:MAG TPA: GAF domain-containing protein, partial [Terriglobales bacterium]|nr:GAF domain-containing protein [Terriglobales bacterium]